jgi:hypothetical protein
MVVPKRGYISPSPAAMTPNFVPDRDWVLKRWSWTRTGDGSRIYGLLRRPPAESYVSYGRDFRSRLLLKMVPDRLETTIPRRALVLTHPHG